MLLPDDRLMQLADEYCALDSEEAHLIKLLRSLRKFQSREIVDQNPRINEFVRKLDTVVSCELLGVADFSECA